MFPGQSHAVLGLIPDDLARIFQVCVSSRRAQQRQKCMVPVHHCSVRGLTFLCTLLALFAMAEVDAHRIMVWAPLAHERRHTSQILPTLFNEGGQQLSGM